MDVENFSNEENVFYETIRKNGVFDIIVELIIEHILSRKELEIYSMKKLKLTNEEISEKIGTSKQTVSNLYFRANKKINNFSEKIIAKTDNIKTC